MKKRLVILSVVLAILLVATSITAFGKKDADPLGEVVEFVEAGGGSIHFVPDVNALPYNFQDFPADFSEGIQTWDIDMIDAEKAGDYTGAGVYVAILDTGLATNWRAYFPEERIATELGRGFVDKGVMKEDRTGNYTANVVESKDYHGDHPHGTHVTSTVIGYSIRGTAVDGVAPGAMIIPVKVLETYPALEATFGTDAAVAAGINYIAELAETRPDDSFVINMSLGSLSVISDVEREAIDRAIAAGVIIVTSAGNDGLEGMGSPASYDPVISVGATGWAADLNTCTGEWLLYDDGCYLSGSFWTTDVPEDASAAVSYITDFSARERSDLWPTTDQNIDVVAPGSWVVGPYPASKVPWWAGSENAGASQYYFVGGTSMASPHVAGVAALLLEKDPTLEQADVEFILQSTTDPLPFSGTQPVADPDLGLIYVSWGLDGFDAVGYGLVQVDAALAAIP